MSQAAGQLGAMISRELTSLKAELAAYQEEGDIWKVVPGISNSAGTLALHLAGNLQHFIGAILGKSGYVRDRDAEFASRNLPRNELLNRIDAAITVVGKTLETLSDADLAGDFPEPVAKVRLNTGDFLAHLASHLSYHLGQIDYHRRLVTGSGLTVNAVSPTHLRSARKVS